jgi:hypothetical protein
MLVRTDLSGGGGQELQDHLKTMALFKVNTGLREQEVVNLRWAWEVLVPELGVSVFVIPREHMKLASGTTKQSYL